MKKLTTSEFIEKSIAKHGDVYDYSKVVYVSNKKKIIIICPEHGEFEQTPASHLNGNGCAGCAGNMQLTTETFIEKAITKHGETYDYSKVIYITNNKKILIICPEHGEFKQEPKHHLKGQGCAGCSDRTLTTETFIKKSIVKHGETYEYSKVVYIGAHKKILIICPEHGEFEQTPGNHLKGNGCAECSSNKPLTTETFIEKAITKHGETYDYSKVSYINSRTKIAIICPDHGEFEQEANSHLTGSGCVECVGSKPLTTETFIEKAIAKHGEAYDYSKVVYVSNKKKIIIICPEHGEFKQQPANHLSGQGCAECSGKKQLTTETFIEKAIAKHGETYDYSKVIYITNNKKIIIICPEHGEFKQQPANHLKGSGCAECVGCKPLTTETFIKKAIAKHGEIYDYSKVVYIGALKKILIICPEHGGFEQNPSSHLSGYGCVGCSTSGFDSTKPAILYHICFKLTDSRFTHVEKIGITNRSVKERFSKEDQETFDFYQEYPFENGIDARNMETAIKRATKEHAIEENDSPINDGWTEIRTCNLQPVLLNLLGNI